MSPYRIPPARAQGASRDESGAIAALVLTFLMLVFALLGRAQVDPSAPSTMTMTIVQVFTE